MQGNIRIFVDKHYNKDRKKSGISDQDLRDIAADVLAKPTKGTLGGGVYKKRVGLEDSGTSGGARSIVFYHQGDKFYFYDGWEKKDVPKSGPEIPEDLVKAYKVQSKVYKAMTAEQLKAELKSKELVEIPSAKPEKKDD